jgi:hypothetical protein
MLRDRPSPQIETTTTGLPCKNPPFIPAVEGMKNNPTTTAPIAAVETSPVMPEFIRLPKPGTHCRWTGLSRSKLNELILPSPLNSFKPPVRSLSLRNRGQLKAVRLIALDSLLGYLRGLLEQQSMSNGDQSPSCG